VPARDADTPDADAEMEARSAALDALAETEPIDGE